MWCGAGEETVLTGIRPSELSGPGSCQTSSSVGNTWPEILTGLLQERSSCFPLTGQGRSHWPDTECQGICGTMWIREGQQNSCCSGLPLCQIQLLSSRLNYFNFDLLIFMLNYRLMQYCTMLFFINICPPKINILIPVPDTLLQILMKNHEDKISSLVDFVCW